MTTARPAFPPARRRLFRGARLATLVPGLGDDPADPWGLIAEGALLVRGERIEWAGRCAALPAGALVDEEHELGGHLVTPGLIDAHTHLVYGGQRAREFELRLGGATYEQIARAGGGIRATVAATRAASEDELVGLASRRLASLQAGGVTTLEVKSGYGLSEAEEAKCLRAARRLGAGGRATVRVTSLAAHALPPEFEGRADAYVEAVCDWLPRWHAQGLVDAVDAFCERIAFSPGQTRRVFAAARALGLPVKLHAEQLSDSGGAALAASFGALSCDHLEHLGPPGVAALKAAGTVAVLLPGAFHFLRETRLPPVAALRAAGVPLAVATDHNPGTSPLLSMPLAIHLACLCMGLTPLEAVRGATEVAARALGLVDRGRLAPGLRADLAFWDFGHPGELAYWFGHDAGRGVVVGGVPLGPPPRS